VCGSPRLCRRRERRLIGARFGRWREDRFGRARCWTLLYSLLLSVWVDPRRAYTTHLDGLVELPLLSQRHGHSIYIVSRTSRTLRKRLVNPIPPPVLLTKNKTPSTKSYNNNTDIYTIPRTWTASCSFPCCRSTIASLTRSVSSAGRSSRAYVLNTRSDDINTILYSDFTYFVNTFTLNMYVSMPGKGFNRRNTLFVFLRRRHRNT